jgi:RND family efflux transporter MFP subunit
VLLAGCNRAPAKTPSAAAPPEKPKDESTLARTTLPPQDAASLGIKSEEIKPRLVQEHTRLTGWIMARQGNEVTVTAPVAGYVRVADKGKLVPVAGEQVEAGQKLLSMEPILSPVEQIQMATLKLGVEAELSKANKNVEVAKFELERVKELARPEKGIRTKQDVEQAEARLKNAESDLSSARNKLKLFAESRDGKRGADLKSLDLSAPRAGTVLTVHVSPGQYVLAAAPLVTIADLSDPWVRVPIPEQDLPRVNLKEEATLLLKGPQTKGIKVQPVFLVPLVDSGRHTVDMIYQLKPPKDLPLAKDQMMAVLVPLDKKSPESVVPYTAVMYDSYGGTWVYVDKSSAKGKVQEYERRRVELGPSVEDGVVIRPTLTAGERVVIAGAAELFSREFYKPPVHKVQP